ncbi:MAG: histidine--tRNA ligase, partial [Polaromonas sp.]|nr:histidine--tRNA ligase [Polaromonas sp.]
TAGIHVQMHGATGEGMGSMKSQFKKADGSGARYALIFGETELAQGCVAVKPLRGAKDQPPQVQALQPLGNVAAWAGTLRG